MAHVDPDVLAHHPAWETRVSQTEGSILAGKVTSTRYSFEPSADQEPPFTGVLVVFSIRGLSRLQVEELLARAEDAVERFAVEEGIDLDTGHSSDGTRTTAGGATSQWFTRRGTVQGTSGVFADGESVRILGEAWHDGISRTSVVAVATAQTTREGSLLGLQDVTDMRTWNRLVADPSGNIEGQRGDGFVYHVVSHA